MGKLAVTAFTTLDNVAEDPHLWSGAYFSVEGAGKFNDEVLGEADALLLGRVTYEGFAAAWPQRTGEFADKFNSMPKYVVSSTLENPEWTNTTVAGSDPVAAATKLRDDESLGDVVVAGSAQLAQSLLEHDLVDELRLMVFPVVLGAGKRLFGETSDPKKLRLVDSKVVGDGVLILVYGRA